MIYYIFFTILLTFALFCVWQISKTDIQRRIIPDVYLFPLLLTGLIILTFFSWPVSIKEGEARRKFVEIHDLRIFKTHLAQQLLGSLHRLLAARHRQSEAQLGLAVVHRIAVRLYLLGVVCLVYFFVRSRI